MTEHEASRTLVKSPPELWAELSDATSLARHLDQFGEIRITRLEPETAVAWEGERASGTVRIEPSGWGTRVILKATAGEVVEAAPAEEQEVVADEPVAVADPEPVADVAEPTADVDPVPTADVDPEPAAPAPVPVPPRAGFFVRLRGRFGARAAVAEPDPPAVEEPEAVSVPEPDPPAIAEPEPIEVPEPEPVAVAAPAPDPPAAIQPDPPVAVALTAALDSLGQAHHRPFSRG